MTQPSGKNDMFALPDSSTANETDNLEKKSGETEQDTGKNCEEEQRQQSHETDKPSTSSSTSKKPLNTEPKPENNQEDKIDNIELFNCFPTVKLSRPKKRSPPRSVMCQDTPRSRPTSNGSKSYLDHPYFDLCKMFNVATCSIIMELNEANRVLRERNSGNDSSDDNESGYEFSDSD